MTKTTREIEKEKNMNGVLLAIVVSVLISVIISVLYSNSFIKDEIPQKVCRNITITTDKVYCHYVIIGEYKTRDICENETTTKEVCKLKSLKEVKQDAYKIRQDTQDFMTTQKQKILEDK